MKILLFSLLYLLISSAFAWALFYGANNGVKHHDAWALFYGANNGVKHHD
jgi:hypothetical protein